MNFQEFEQRIRKDFPSYHIDTNRKAKKTPTSIYMLDGELIQIDHVSSEDEQLKVAIRPSGLSFGTTNFSIENEADYFFFVQLLKNFRKFC